MEKQKGIIENNIMIAEFMRHDEETLFNEIVYSYTERDGTTKFMEAEELDYHNNWLILWQVMDRIHSIGEYARYETDVLSPHIHVAYQQVCEFIEWFKLQEAANRPYGYVGNGVSQTGQNEFPAIELDDWERSMLSKMDRGLGQYGPEWLFGILRQTGTVEVGWRDFRNRVDNTELVYNKWDEFIEILRGRGYSVEEKWVAHDEAYATLPNGFWNSIIYSVIPAGTPSGD